MIIAPGWLMAWIPKNHGCSSSSHSLTHSLHPYCRSRESSQLTPDSLISAELISAYEKLLGGGCLLKRPFSPYELLLHIERKKKKEKKKEITPAPSSGRIIYCTCQPLRWWWIAWPYHDAVITPSSSDQCNNPPGDCHTLNDLHLLEVPF